MSRYVSKEITLNDTVVAPGDEILYGLWTIKEQNGPVIKNKERDDINKTSKIFTDVFEIGKTYEVSLQLVRKTGVTVSTEPIVVVAVDTEGKYILDPMPSVVDTPILTPSHPVDNVPENGFYVTGSPISVSGNATHRFTSVWLVDEYNNLIWNDFLNDKELYKYKLPDDMAFDSTKLYTMYVVYIANNNDASAAASIQFKVKYNPYKKMKMIVVDANNPNDPNPKEVKELYKDFSFSIRPKLDTKEQINITKVDYKGTNEDNTRLLFTGTSYDGVVHLDLEAKFKQLFPTGKHRDLLSKINQYVSHIRIKDKVYSVPSTITKDFFVFDLNLQTFKVHTIKNTAFKFSRPVLVGNKVVYVNTYDQRAMSIDYDTEEFIEDDVNFRPAIKGNWYYVLSTGTTIIHGIESDTNKLCINTGILNIPLNSNEYYFRTSDFKFIIRDKLFIINHKFKHMVIIKLKDTDQSKSNVQDYYVDHKIVELDDTLVNNPSQIYGLDNTVCHLEGDSMYIRSAPTLLARYDYDGTVVIYPDTYNPKTYIDLFKYGNRLYYTSMTDEIKYIDLISKKIKTQSLSGLNSDENYYKLFAYNGRLLGFSIFRDRLIEIAENTVKEVGPDLNHSRYFRMGDYNKELDKLANIYDVVTLQNDNLFIFSPGTSTDIQTSSAGVISLNSIENKIGNISNVDKLIFKANIYVDGYAIGWKTAEITMKKFLIPVNEMNNAITYENKLESKSVTIDSYDPIIFTNPNIRGNTYQLYDGDIILLGKNNQLVRYEMDSDYNLTPKGLWQVNNLVFNTKINNMSARSFDTGDVVLLIEDPDLRLIHIKFNPNKPNWYAVEKVYSLKNCTINTYTSIQFSKLDNNRYIIVSVNNKITNSMDIYKVNIEKSLLELMFLSVQSDKLDMNLIKDHSNEQLYLRGGHEENMTHVANEIGFNLKRKKAQGDFYIDMSEYLSGNTDEFGNCSGVILGNLYIAPNEGDHMLCINVFTGEVKKIDTLGVKHFVGKPLLVPGEYFCFLSKDSKILYYSIEQSQWKTKALHSEPKDLAPILISPYGMSYIDVNNKLVKYNNYMYYDSSSNISEDIEMLIYSPTSGYNWAIPTSRTKIYRYDISNLESNDFPTVPNGEYLGVGLGYNNSAIIPRNSIGNSMWYFIRENPPSPVGDLKYGKLLGNPVAINNRAYFIGSDNRAYTINVHTSITSKQIPVAVGDIRKVYAMTDGYIMGVREPGNSKVLLMYHGLPEKAIDVEVDPTLLNNLDELIYIKLTNMFYRLNKADKRIDVININTATLDINRGKDVYKLPIPDININNKFQSKLFKNVYLQNNKQLLLNTDRLEVDSNGNTTQVATIPPPIDTTRLTNEYGLMVNEKYIYYPGKKTDTNDWYLHKYNIDTNEAKILEDYKLLTDTPFANNPTGDMYRIKGVDYIPIMASIVANKLLLLKVSDDTIHTTETMPSSDLGKQVTVVFERDVNTVYCYLEDSTNINPYIILMDHGSVRPMNNGIRNLDLKNENRLALYQDERIGIMFNLRYPIDIDKDTMHWVDGQIGYGDGILRYENLSNVITAVDKPSIWHVNSTNNTPARGSSDVATMLGDPYTTNINVYSRMTARFNVIDMAKLTEPDFGNNTIVNHVSDPIDVTQWINPLAICMNNYNAYIFYRNGDIVVLGYNGYDVIKVNRYKYNEFNNLPSLTTYNDQFGKIYLALGGLNKLGMLDVETNDISFITPPSGIDISGTTKIISRDNKPTELLLIGKTGIYTLTKSTNEIAKMKNVEFTSNAAPIILRQDTRVVVLNGPIRNIVTIRINKKLELDRIIDTATREVQGDTFSTLYLKKNNLIIDANKFGLMINDTDINLNTYIKLLRNQHLEEYKIHNGKRILEIDSPIIPLIYSDEENIELVSVFNPSKVLKSSPLSNPNKDVVYHITYYKKKNKQVYVLSNRLNNKEDTTVVISDDGNHTITNKSTTNYRFRNHFTLDNKDSYILRQRIDEVAIHLFMDTGSDIIDYKEVNSAGYYPNTMDSGGNSMEFILIEDALAINDAYAILGMKAIKAPYVPVALSYFVIIDRKNTQWRLVNIEERLTSTDTYSGYDDLYYIDKVDRHIGDIIHVVALNDNKFILVGHSGLLIHVKINNIESLDIKSVGDNSIVSKLTTSSTRLSVDHIHDITIDDKVYLSIFKEAGMHVIDKNTGDVTYVDNNDIVYDEDIEKGTRGAMIVNSINKDEVLFTTRKGVTAFNYKTNKFRLMGLERGDIQKSNSLSHRGFLLDVKDGIYAAIPDSSLRLKYQLGSVREYIDKGLPLPDPEDPKYVLGTDVDTFKKSRAIVCTGFGQNTATYNTDAAKNLILTPGERYEFCIYLANGKRIFLSTVNNAPKALIYK